jgi:hypothetical protein
MLSQMDLENILTSFISILILHSQPTPKFYACCIALRFSYKLYTHSSVTYVAHLIDLIILVISSRIDPLLGKDLVTNETTAVAMQRHGKHASTTQ